MSCFGFPGGTSGKESACQIRDIRDVSLIPRSGRFPGVGNDNPTRVFLPGESHGQRSLVGYRPQGHKESDTTEATWHACMWISKCSPQTSYINITQELCDLACMHACGSQSVVPRPAISTSLRSFLAIMILGGPKTYQTERVGPRCLFPEALQVNLIQLKFETHGT